MASVAAMGVKFAKALGAHVVLFTTSPNKSEDAVRLGASEVVISKNEVPHEDESLQRVLSLNVSPHYTDGSDVLIAGLCTLRGGLHVQQEYMSSCVLDARCQRIRHHHHTMVLMVCV